MDFTREPIIETVITPKEGFKLVVRSSKSSGQEEYFVDAVEVVSFGSSFYFRSQERPKSFLVPATDYEVLEVREARMVLKNVGLDRSIKIGGGREASVKPSKETVETEVTEEVTAEIPAEGRLDKKRDRRRHSRRRRGREEVSKEILEEVPTEEPKIDLPEPIQLQPRDSVPAEPLTSSSAILSSILPPPPTLISDTIARYKENAMFKGAFFMKDEEAKISESEMNISSIEPSPLEEDVYKQQGNFTLEDTHEGEVSTDNKNNLSSS